MKQIACCWSSAFSRYLGIVVVLLATAVVAYGPARAASGGETKSAAGLTVYLGVVPAELVKGPGPHSADRSMHGGSPRGSHEHHIVIAVYDSTTNARIEDATVTAKVSGLGLSGPQKTLEPMKIADTITYGAFFNLTADLYTIRVTVQRSSSQPVVLDFKYDHRRP
ncbi:hypothetical protein PY365_27170 [Roseiarcaceae bacterium H3SJ34-1]|uniref:hypothetical protein n=1 Tax=Terripilifer ovatus TaxID=3032367 RepID=UPI003AB95AE4|nr:hypothetical protein [Roseiarcaceae bacterium H3SJ34-1]